MDWILIMLIVLFIATLAAFYAGMLPYPIGWLVLAALIVLRVNQIRRRP